MFWSFKAGKTVDPIRNDSDQWTCPETGSLEIVEFNHVRDIEPSRVYPTVFVIDPHPRKPHMFCWIQIDPHDDYAVILESEVQGTTTEVFEQVRALEYTYGLQVCLRLMDPNMGMQAGAASRARDTTWQDEFSESGLFCDLASNSEVGRERINEYLQPDRYTLRPRLSVAITCPVMINQLKRYTWDDHKRALEKDLKQAPKRKYDDYPTMLRYFMNALPTFRNLLHGPEVLKRGRY